MVTIAVEGASERRVAAERAVVRLQLVGEGANTSEALEAAAASEAGLARELDALVADATITAWTADDIGTGVRHHTEDGDPLPSPVHEARVELRVEADRIDGLSVWLATITDGRLVEIAGIEWSLSATTRTEVLRQLRAEAVADALARAAEYAATLGASGVEVVALAEPGVRGGATLRSGWTAQSAGLRRQSRKRSHLELRPQQIQVSASVFLDARTT